MARPLAALLSDSAEKCREQAALLLTDAASGLANPAALLPALSATLAQVCVPTRSPCAWTACDPLGVLSCGNADQGMLSAWPPFMVQRCTQLAH